MNDLRWILCPVCHNKTRLKVREDTVVLNLPLFCPKCKKETLINLKKFQIELVNESDA